MFIASGFSSSSKLDFKLSDASNTTDDLELASIYFYSTTFDITEKGNYLNTNIHTNHNKKSNYFHSHIPTYITQNHILKQS